MSRGSGFVTEVWTALALCLAAAAVAAGGAVVLGEAAASRAAVAALGLAYVLRGLARRRVRAGHVAAVALWALFAAIAWPLTSGLAGYACVHVGLIWLARAAFTHRSLSSRLIDLGLCALALSAAVWASAWTQSLLIAAWCFCLVQALHVTIPATVAGPAADSHRAFDPGTRFERARRAAEGALERIANT
jgi:hypothetical protein